MSFFLDFAGPPPDTRRIGCRVKRTGSGPEYFRATHVMAAFMSARGRRTRQVGAGAFSFLTLAILLVLSAPLAAQSPSSKELETREVEPTYKLEVERNLVLVRAVVRDAKGQTISNLKQDDFRLFDNGKPQAISHFSVVIPVSRRAAAPPAAGSARKEAEEGAPESELSPDSPRRFLGLFFDDVHMDFGEVGRVRDAADGYLAEALTAGDRVGIFTASGQGNVDFTEDRDKLHAALFRLRSRPTTFEEMQPCPDMFDYQAYLIIHQHNAFAEDAAVEETLRCRYQNDRNFIQSARSEAQAAAFQKLEHYRADTESALRGLEEIVRRMAYVPGQRSIVLVSPGFLAVSDELRIEEIVNRALRNQVIISTLDSHGLYAPIPLGDASKNPMVISDRPDLMGHKLEFEQLALTLRSEPLQQLAGDTGGFYFRNSNDYKQGFHRAGALPEVYYSLAFSPQGLKLDGRFHTVKIKLVNYPSLAVEARRGYFAPAKSQDADARVKEEITQALYSQDELSGIPLEVHTQFFKRNELETNLSVLMHMDLRFLQFRRVDGRNLNDLTVITALFDRNGNYVAGREKRVEFKLLDSSLEKFVQYGLNMRTSFSVKPGTYLVRQVVRDTEGARISGSTRTVEIPY